jgi:hypothetical protein
MMDVKKYIELTIIDHNSDSNPTKQNIVNSINTYLIRNKGAVSDFNLIKDIVDRNIDSEEEEIYSKLSIPLYLGLIGTMLGIIVGLMFLPEITTMVSGSKGDLSGIDDLLGGVKIAMIASFIGLSLTVYSSGFLFKGAKQKAEEQKNKFYSFIQAKLLPKLTDNASTGIYSLQNNLLKFNEGFTDNMNNFSGILTKVHTSLDSQVQLIDELKRVDISTMAKANVTVLKELKYSISQLESFGLFLEQMNVFVNSTKTLNSTVNEQLKTIGDFSAVINNLNENAENQLKLSSYLASYFQQFESREQSFSNSISNFDSHINDLLENLKISFIERAQDYNNTDIQLTDGFKELFSDIKNSMNHLFTEQNSNIKEINKQIAQLSNFKSDVNKLSIEITKQNDKIDAISSGNLDPFQNFKISKPIKWLVYSFLILGSIVFASIVFSMISNFF